MRLKLLAFFLISGACGLIYEIAWLRVLALVFGNTTYATSTVLAGYMAGLGLGALYFGKHVDSSGRPLRLYAMLEGGVALYALLTPLVWKAAELLHLGFYRAVHPSFAVFALFKFAVAVAALLVPTFLMGGTLPVVCKYFVRRNQDVSREVGLLYGVNTLGAMLGVLASGFFSLAVLGVWQSVFVAAAANVAIYVACRKLSQQVGEQPHAGGAAAPVAPAGSGLKGVPLALLGLFAVSGAVSMIYEVGWTRVLATTVGSSVYAFSVMLATFLFGLAAGSFLWSRLAGSLRAGLAAFSVLQLATAAFGLLGVNQFDDLPYYFLRMYAWSGGLGWALDVGRFFLCSIVMLPPTLCIGALFACFIEVYSRWGGVGRRVGVAYFANTIGAILGSVLTGFALIPAIGIQSTLLLAAALNAVVGIAAFFLSSENFRWKRMGVVGAMTALVVVSANAVEPWNKKVLASDIAVKPMPLLNFTREQIQESMREKQILFYREGVSSTVSVTKLRDRISLAVNGKVDASTGDAFTQYLLGHLPMLVTPNAKRVCVIGVGSASTAAAVAAYPVERIDCVELEPAVIEGAKFFSKLNRDVLKDPRVRTVLEDGRNFLAVNPDAYDVIISEPSNPWMAGVANLFSYEHYRTMAKRLTPGGTVCQWLHAYSMSREDLRMILRTFSLAFKDVSLWTSLYPDLMLLGRNEAAPIDFKYLQEAFRNPVVAGDFAAHGVRKPEGLFSSFWLGDAEIRQASAGAKINSDNHPVLEFSAPRYLYSNTTQPNFEYLDGLRTWAFPPILNLEPPAIDNTSFLTAVSRGFLAKSMFRQAEVMLNRARQVNAEDPVFLETLGIFLYSSDRLDDAAPILLRAVSLNPASFDTYLYLGKTAQKQGGLDRAAGAYAQAVALAPDNPEGLVALADSLLAAKQPAAALPLYDRAITLKGGSDFDLLTRMGDIVFEIGDMSQKVSISEVLMERYPRWGGAYTRLGQLLEAEGAFERALPVYQFMAREFPDDAASFLNLARVYEKLGRPADMKKAIETAVRVQPALASHPEIRKILS